MYVKLHVMYALCSLHVSIKMSMYKNVLTKRSEQFYILQFTYFIFNLLIVSVNYNKSLLCYILYYYITSHFVVLFKTNLFRFLQLFGFSSESFQLSCSFVQNVNAYPADDREQCYPPIAFKLQSKDSGMQFLVAASSPPLGGLVDFVD